MLISTTYSNFFFYFFYAFAAFFFLFYITGRVILKMTHVFSDSESFILSPLLGMAMFSLSQYFFGFVNLEPVTYLLALGAFFYWLKDAKREIKTIKKGFGFFLKDKLLFLILLLGVPVVLVSVFTSGLLAGNSVGFYSINPIDGNYHIALIRSLVKSIPPEEPGMTGVLVKNYHYFSDLVLAGIIRILPLPIFNLFYQYFPFFLAVFYSLAGYQFSSTLGFGKNSARFFVFFLLFAGGLGYLFMYIFTGSWDFTLTALDNSALIFTNPPRISAQTLLLAGGISFYKWLKTKEKIAGFITAIIFGVTIGFKVYVGLYAACVLGILFLFFLLQKKFAQIWPIFLAIIVSFLVFYPANKDAGGLFFSAFAWPRHFFSQGSTTKLMWHLALDEFKVHSNYLRIFILYLQMTAAFLFITLGTRILGVFGIVKAVQKTGWQFGLSFFAPAFIFPLISVFTLQKSGIYEGFNFLAVSSLSFSFMSAVLLSSLIDYARKKFILLKTLSIGFVLFVIILTPIRSLHEAKRYLNLFIQKSGQIISLSEMENYKKINDMEFIDGLLLTDAKDQLSNYSPWVYAFIGKKMYLSGEGILRAHGLNPKSREVIKEKIFAQKNPSEFVRLAKENDIVYLYLKKSVDRSFYSEEYFTKIIEGEEFLIYKII